MTPCPSPFGHCRPGAVSGRYEFCRLQKAMRARAERMVRGRPASNVLRLPPVLLSTTANLRQPAKMKLLNIALFAITTIFLFGGVDATYKCCKTGCTTPGCTQWFVCYGDSKVENSDAHPVPRVTAPTPSRETVPLANVHLVAALPLVAWATYWALRSPLTRRTIRLQAGEYGPRRHDRHGGHR